MSDTLAEIRETLAKIKYIAADGEDRLRSWAAESKTGNNAEEWLRWCVAEIDRLTAKELQHATVLQYSDSENAKLREALTKMEKVLAYNRADTVNVTLRQMAQLALSGDAGKGRV